METSMNWLRAGCALGWLVVSACGGGGGARTDDVLDPRADASDAALDARDGARDTTAPDVDLTVPREVLRFDRTRGEFPDALAVREGSAFVALVTLGRIVRVEADGTFSAWAEVPLAPGARIEGIAFALDGRLVVAVSSTTTPGANALWIAGPAGGTATMLARHDALTAPGGVAVGNDGSVWITNTRDGAVFKTTLDGAMLVPWARTMPLLAGGAPACGPVAATPTGANGIVVRGDERAVFVVNTDLARVARITVRPDGTAGEVTLFSVSDCPAMRGAWSLAASSEGALYVTASLVDRVTRIDANGRTSSITLPLGFLRSPTGIGYDARSHALWISNSENAALARPGTMPVPSIVRVPLAR
jgi:sugar lactone lactonase YvrE